MEPIKASLPLRILLVEDDEHDRLAFRIAFEKSQVSCEITECIWAEDALLQLLADPSLFDLVVIDHKLPGMSGLDLCKELLRQEIPLPLVLLTGHGSEQLAVEALTDGVDNYIIKDPGHGYLKLLSLVLRDVVRRYGDRLARKRAEEALRESEEKLAGIIASATDHMSMIDKQHNILWANDIAKQLFGPDLVGKKCYSAYHRCDKPCQPCVVRKSFEDGEIHEHETEVIDADGRRMIFWCTASVTARYEDGRPKTVVEISRNITERKRAAEALRKAHDELERRVEERTAELARITEQLKQELTDHERAEKALRESEEKYSTLVENSLTGIYIDQDGKIAFANNRFAKIFGYARDELIGMESRILVHPEDRALTDERRAKRLKGEAVPSEYEARGLTKDGEIIWIARRNTQIEYKGRPAILGNIVDITENLAKETQLIQASKMSTLGEMATGVAHELNQPLSTIQIGTDFLRNMVKQGHKIPDHELALVCEQMAEQVKRAVRIINHLREFGRKAEIQQERLDINEPLKGVFTLLSQQLNLLGIKVVLDLKDDLPPIMGDSIRLEQVFIDVVVNARDAMQEKKERLAGGSLENTLTIRSFHKDDRVVVTVTDTGTGIPDQIKDKIFEPFFTTKKVGKGTGLGLSISYGIIEQYDGTLEVESEVNKGTTFKITFPTCGK